MKMNNQNPMNPYSNYKPQWVCSECGSSDVQSMASAWFDPNNDLAFVDCVEDFSMDWCCTCEGETSLDEVEPPDDPWGNAYGTPNYWIPPEDDEYWEIRVAGHIWTHADEKKYWINRLGESNAT